MNQYPPPGQYGQPDPGQYQSAPPGSYPPPGGPQYWTESPKGKGMAITALVFGIIGLITFFTIFGGVLAGLVGLVLGVIAMVRARRGSAGGFGMALAGAITGALGLIGGLLFGLFAWVVFKDSGGSDLLDCLSKAGNDQAKIQQCQDEFNKRVDDRFGVTITPMPTR
ncbi:DUF4190 domain-containing protein [Nocardia seriolae]|uniref:DUF4190 domain-containing protein n=1 Tax=Nocardia seriolae TaxID=37332 RepID=A0A0B8MZG6_9NOCA|nr:DUF4190 domain-containing protein [Nocardia seriolae]APA94680.1 hypothetical protein NS506_00598 [Nocardia seriolae]MTJ67000.1 DUF4190 domain-containing protein [Nocardia seriolae]MTJ70047.1 DUF4190 domain-containing protein [Nocardia seriolae]MTJ84979.1 DUF4190 domain-containing protein [Nocardia seriolae]MTK28975.1 DUF4190 domain-containing protein [Nocardia seriolae]